MFKLVCGRTRKVLYSSDRKMDVVYRHQRYSRADRVRLVEA